MENLPELKLDPWQKEFLETSGNKILCCGRQVGKSVIAARDAGNYALKHPKKQILMIAPTERQAYELFDKTLGYISDKAFSKIKKGKDRPTKHKINLTNGSTIWCLPTGLTGTGIRGRTVHRLYVDEASRVPEEVWTAVTPMLLTTGGDLILLSTPFGRQGYFYKIWANTENSYSKFGITSLEVIESREVCDSWSKLQREKALEYLEYERSEMSALEYAQEYEGRFIDELRQFFPNDIIEAVCSLKSSENTPREPYYSQHRQTDRFLGVDIARLGEDDTVLFNLERINRKTLKQIDMKILKKTMLTETARMILAEDRHQNFKRIYIDDGGLGAGVLDILLEDEQTRRKVEAINNSSRSLNRDDTQKKRILKEDLYTNLLRIMEQKKIQLFDDEEIVHSLRSIQYEYTNKGIRIFGRYTHITEALIRAAWCLHDKSLNIWCS
jgi:hypothetical protein